MWHGQAEILRQPIVQCIAEPERQASNADDQNRTRQHQILLMPMTSPNFASPSLLGILLALTLPVDFADVNVEMDERHDGYNGDKQVATAETTRQLSVAVQCAVIAASWNAELNEQRRESSPQ